ncbi:MAG: competence protein ComEA, partial [Thermoleophilaceae bacterium]|nr:competence protein ComEA [Thermoleophilaceae bacterium]
FRLPGGYRSGAKIVGLRGEQAARKVLRFVTSVKNVGQVAESPHHARLKIVDAQGRVRARARWLGALILPGYTREFPVLLKKVLPAGNYTAITRMTFGRNGLAQTRRYRFRLAGPNQLPTRKLALRGGAASGEIGKPAKLGFRVANVGSAVSPVVTDVFLERLRTGRSSVIAGRRHIAYASIGIGATKRYAAELGKVEPGSYRVILRLSDGKTFFDQLIAGFTAKKHHGLLGRFFGWLGDHIAVIIAALSLLGLLAALFLLLLARRRLRDEDVQDGAIARPGTPPPAAPVAPAVPVVALPASRNGDSVDINSAGVAELMTLPGLGRLAATRIVDHRQANGPFRSLDDLNRVEGFHAERIERLRGLARV